VNDWAVAGVVQQARRAVETDAHRNFLIMTIPPVDQY
jgi:hypothetical protein